MLLLLGVPATYWILNKIKSHKQERIDEEADYLLAKGKKELINETVQEMTGSTKIRSKSNRSIDPDFDVLTNRVMRASSTKEALNYLRRSLQLAEAEHQGWEVPDLDRNRFGYRGYAKMAGLAMAGIAAGIVENYGNTWNLHETIIKKLCCTHSDEKRANFIQSIPEYFTTFKPYLHATVGATIAPIANLARKIFKK